MPLGKLFTRYGTDKGIWGYTDAYRHFLETERMTIENVLEIGICGHRDIPNNVVGASLFAWRDYFPYATIHGIDNDLRFIFNDQARIKTALCDAYDPQQLGRTLAYWGNTRFDFICDDAVHDPLPQISLCQMLWPFLRRGGVYAIEEACPYKVMNNNLTQMVSVLMRNHADMHVTEITTHKGERLLILRKEP